MFTARKVSARTIALVATALVVVAGLITVLIVLISDNDKPNANDHTVIQPKPQIETQPYQQVVGIDGKKLWVDVEHSPALNCPDHRNHDKPYTAERDVHQFVPCVNGMIHLRITADGTVKLVRADGKLDLQNIGDAVRNEDTPAEGWKIYGYTRKEKDTLRAVNMYLSPLSGASSEQDAL